MTKNEFKEIIGKLLSNDYDLYYMIVGYLDGKRENEENKDIKILLQKFVHSSGQIGIVN